jgi:hypothetical protein
MLASRNRGLRADQQSKTTNNLRVSLMAERINVLPEIGFFYSQPGQCTRPGVREVCKLNVSMLAWSSCAMLAEQLICHIEAYPFLLGEAKSSLPWLYPGASFSES